MKKIWIDTNIIIRFLVKDVESQYSEAKQFFSDIEVEKRIGLLSLLVVNEAIWILENYYELKREQYIPSLLELLALLSIRMVEVKKMIVTEILEKMMGNTYDFTDMYLVYISQGKDIFSFDKGLMKLMK